MDQVDAVGWCVLQLRGCGKKAGMETSKDAETNDKITLITAGKVLVVDIELVMDCSDETRPSCSALLSWRHTPRPSAVRRLRARL